MQRPTIFIKSIADYKQLTHTQQLNSNIELQLQKDFENSDWNCEFFLKTIKKQKINLSIIHSPLLEKDAVDLSRLYEEKQYQLLYKTCELAEAVSRMTKKRTFVVVHYEGCFDMLQKNKEALELIVRRTKNLIELFPRVDIGVENVIPFTKDGFARNGFLDENVLLVKYLRSELSAPRRIFTVLDTCHAMVSQRILSRCNLPFYSLEKYMKLNAETIGLIHLANVKNLGYGDFEHGVGFETPSEISILKDFYAYYQKYNYSCPITIEVQERDYFKRLEYLKTLRVLNSIIEDSNN